MFTLRFAQSSSSLFPHFREMGESVMAERIDPATIEGYHAHIYYDEGSRETAAHIREQLEQNFTVKMGPWRVHPREDGQYGWRTTRGGLRPHRRSRQSAP